MAKGTQIDLSKLTGRRGTSHVMPTCSGECNPELQAMIALNRGKFKNPRHIETLQTIGQMCPQAQILFGVKMVDRRIAASHLNGRLKHDFAPLLSLNSFDRDMKWLDISLIQSFYGTDEDHVKAVTRALMFMSLSNPRPKEWIFVEAQKNQSDARFGWISKLGIHYVFRQISDRQDYFIKEQLWNLGTRMATTDKFVFMDADVAYCQTDWLNHVNKTFDEGCQLFQPHAWSWKADEDTQPKFADNLNLLESFGHMRKNGLGIQDFNGHTGYDIAITRSHYNTIHGFYSLPRTGGDFFMWMLLTQDIFMCPGIPYTKAIEEILKTNPVPTTPIGCSELICFHNHHTNTWESEKKYEKDFIDIRNSDNPIRLLTNNFGTDNILEMDI